MVGIRKKCHRCDRALSAKRVRKKYCFPCERVVKRERTAAQHDKYVCATYGLRPGEYQKILDHQGGKCAICRRATGATRRLAVDHDHAIGDGKREAVRGGLCRPCNRMLGHGRDDPEFFMRAARYLESPPARKVLGA